MVKIVKPYVEGGILSRDLYVFVLATGRLRNSVENSSYDAIIALAGIIKRFINAAI